MAILAAAVFFLFFHLDHRPFWQDEAETACLARNVLNFGVPLAFDGLNVISQEEGRELSGDSLWRWSPWLQIYVTAAAFEIGGLNTFTGRFPFAVLGLLCIWVVYFLTRHEFDDPLYARASAALLTFSVLFLLFARQCRYYSLGAFLTLTSLYAFRRNWQTRFGPAFLLVLSLGLLFHTNYLLFFSYVGPFFLAALWLFPESLPPRRTIILALATGIIILPGLFFFNFQGQAALQGNLNITDVMLVHLEKYFVDFLQFMFPLPVALYLFWRWRRVFWGGGLPQEPGERFVFFLVLIIVGNILLLTPVPQSEYRYLIHLYPLSAVILGWTFCQVWRFHKFSGILLALLLLLTNWLQVLPMTWVGLVDRPINTDVHMLTYPNLTLKNFLSELSRPYPDVHQNLIQFFQAHAKPGETILTTYGDLPLQFYTPYRIVGGLQGRMPDKDYLPDWVVKRWHTRWNREYLLNPSEVFVRHLKLSEDYQAITLPYEDEMFGNQADPYYHRFIPPEPIARLIIYRKKDNVAAHAP